jgi:adenine-specific DNA-methyltransferase
MQNLLQDLENLLKTATYTDYKGEIAKYTDYNGTVVKNIVVEIALQLHPDLLRTLLKNERLKEQFFTDIDGILVFDKVAFIRFVNLKEFMADSYTKFTKKIGLALDSPHNEFLYEKQNVVLNFPHKDCILQGGQTKEDNKNRTEVFWNTLLAKDQIDSLFDRKILTNLKKFVGKPIFAPKTQELLPEEPKIIGYEAIQEKVTKFETTDNFIIKGNNLIALHCLKHRYEGKIKLIYIDPPYNTGNDSFRYNDQFNHSAWLVFMKNRLDIAKKLLAKDGSIWINIDDKEVHYLKVMCDEIFGRENFIANIIWEKNYSPRMDSQSFSASHDHILCYSRTGTFKVKKQVFEQNSDQFNFKDEKTGKFYRRRSIRKEGSNSLRTDAPSMFFPLIAPNGEEIYPIKPSSNIESCWRWSLKTYKENLEKELVEWVLTENYGWQVYAKQFIDENASKPPETIWSHEDAGNTHEAKQEVKTLFTLDEFSTPKPEKLLQRIIELATNKGDMVLDFFAGSGTTLAVAHKLGRRYIGIEQMDYIENIPLIRLIKVIEGEQGGVSKSVNWTGGGAVIYCELQKYNELYAEKIQIAETAERLTEIRAEMLDKAFMNYLYREDDLAANETDFLALDLPSQKQFLLALLDLNQLYVNVADSMDTVVFGDSVSKEDLRLSREFYQKI